MRDAFGGTFLIEILMVFVVLFVSFTAVIVNVAKTFRVKNQIINIIEQTQYSGGQPEAVDNYFKNNKVGYYVVNSDEKTKCENADGVWGDYGYCITPIYSTNKSKADYYRVTVYVSISLPLNLITDTITLPISGESKSYQSLN